MAETESASSTMEARTIPRGTVPLQISPLSNISLPPPAPIAKLRSTHLNLDTFSPVNQNGSFEFDRVLKSGYVQKRTRKTKAWKSIYLVLRPNLLSIYKDQNESKLRHKIHLSDVTAVAFLKDPKQKRQHVFGLFLPSRNYHLEASSKRDADEWVELIRQEARIEEEEEEMLLASPSGNTIGMSDRFESEMRKKVERNRLEEERLGSSSPEPSDPIPRSRRPPMNSTTSHRRVSHTIDYSGNELASHSDISDQELPRALGYLNTPIPGTEIPGQVPDSDRPMLTGRNVSQMGGFNMEQDPERVVWQGHLLLLKTKGGVKQWKDLWLVLRPKTVALYKDESEYSPLLIIPLPSIIDVVEIDPVSRTKTHCMQVITEEKRYRFCASSEEILDKSMGAFKSLLASKKVGL